MKKSYEVAVIGGGIIGCSIAYYLAKENVDVAVFENDQIGGKTTSAAAGMLGAHSECEDLDVFYPFARDSQLAYFTLREELKEHSGIDLQWKTGGIYKLAFSENEKLQLNSMLALPTIEWHEPEEVRTNVEDVSEKIIGAAYIKDDVHVLPKATCQAFGKSAQQLGASIHESTPVHTIEKIDGVFSLKTAAGSVEAKYVVVASGVWSTRYFESFGLGEKVLPVKGECLAVQSGNVSLKRTLFHDSSYILPRNNNTFVIGATMVENDWNEKATMGGIEALIKKAKEILPSIGELQIESFWAGLRPKTFDHKPFIGVHPGDDNILFATGHFRNGILLAPATGQMIRDLILGRKVREDWLEAFKIDRQKAWIQKQAGILEVH